MTDDEKRELLDRIARWKLEFGFRGEDWTDADQQVYSKLRALINAPPPKHTQCENCLDDLEDYVWVYCDKCWQKLLTDLKKARPVVDEKFIAEWAEGIWADSNLGVMQVQYLLKAALQEAGVRIKGEK